MKYTLAQIHDGLVARTYNTIELLEAEELSNNPDLDIGRLTEKQANMVALWRSKTEQEWAFIEELALTIIPNVGNTVYYNGMMAGFWMTIVGMNHLFIVASGPALQAIVPLNELEMSYDDKGRMHYYFDYNTPGLQLRAL